MTFSKKYVVLILFFFFISAIVYYIFFRTQNVSFVWQNKNVTLMTASPVSVTKKLKQLKVIDGKIVKNLTIIISDQNIDSMYSQADKDGNEFVSSKYRIDRSGGATITLYAGGVFFTFPKDHQAKLLDSYFWQIADLMSILNTYVNKPNTDHMQIFLPSP